jgi:hypothetical protein
VGVFFRREIVLRDEFGCDGWFGHFRFQIVDSRIGIT